MVVLHIKKGEESLFLYETTTDSPLGDLTSQLVEIQNLRLRLGRLISGKFDWFLPGLIASDLTSIDYQLLKLSNIATYLVD